ncbi:hypothetical protein [Streptosporangium carneum]|uniref:Uncharacterized protein n=1 Tax=Streptosporangium carneum TaxID=47481 RepID=A0A9W6I297_9ACTN|nr:hypothetical protein [Streptosporangium carneum]GLK10695.1 hypothetical protein GCM10017600_41010 [Streptosporangium carneum]
MSLAVGGPTATGAHAAQAPLDPGGEAFLIRRGGNALADPRQKPTRHHHGTRTRR